MSARLIGLAATIALLASPALGGDPNLAGLRTLMSCVVEPAPTPVLLALIGQGALVERTGPGFDEDYCWSLAVPYQWQGATFSGMCVVTGDPTDQAGHPDLYWPGARAPWTEVWLISSTSPDALQAWAVGALPAGSRYEIDPLGDEAGGSALSCSEWHFPLG